MDSNKGQWESGQRPAELGAWAAGEMQHLPPSPRKEVSVLSAQVTPSGGGKRAGSGPTEMLNEVSEESQVGRGGRPETGEPPSPHFRGRDRGTG